MKKGDKKDKSVKKNEDGKLDKDGVEDGSGMWELRMDEGEELNVGKRIRVEMFDEVKKVEVNGKYKGKGLEGKVKRWKLSKKEDNKGK